MKVGGASASIFYSQKLAGVKQEPDNLIFLSLFLLVWSSALFIFHSSQAQ